MTAELVGKIATLIARGLTDEQAAAVCDVSDKTITNWRKKPEFFRAVKKATAIRLVQRLQRIEEGKRGWQGTAWALERLHREQFSPPKSTAAIEHSGGVGITVTAALAGEIAAARAARAIQPAPPQPLAENTNTATDPAVIDV